jgi:hypothetical protein
MNFIKIRIKNRTSNFPRLARLETYQLERNITHITSEGDGLGRPTNSNEQMFEY